MEVDAAVWAQAVAHEPSCLPSGARELSHDDTSVSGVSESRLRSLGTGTRRHSNPTGPRAHRRHPAPSRFSAKRVTINCHCSGQRFMNSSHRAGVSVGGPSSSSLGASSRHVLSISSNTAELHVAAAPDCGHPAVPTWQRALHNGAPYTRDRPPTCRPSSSFCIASLDGGR